MAFGLQFVRFRAPTAGAIRRIAVLAGLLLAGPTPVLANDSEAEVGIGGITLKPSSALVMASEDLFISEELVRVKYRFANPTIADITTTVAFPLPRQPREMGDQAMYPEGIEPWTGFGFSTKVDGAPVRLQAVERAMIGDKDVTDRIAEIGLPLYWFRDWYADASPVRAQFDALPESQRAAWQAEGLLTEEQDWGAGLAPAWDVATYFVREQTVPAGGSVIVEHEYKPVAGGSVGGALHADVRESNPMLMAYYRDQWCVDDFFIRGFDKRLAERQAPGKQITYMETWLRYILSTGANWQGPIGDFRLVIDKGSVDNLVSFCMDGVKKIAPTQFEVRKTNFEPDRDLDILILKFFEYDE